MSLTYPGAVSLGRVIDGRFPLLRYLGGSEWSTAYLTELDIDPAKKAAIKIFPYASVDPLATGAQWGVARTLSHPHLMPLFHAARIDADGEDLLYVVTEYADETLSQVLPERPLTPEEAREMLGPILDALSYLHQLGLAHGHLRPTNIMVVDDHLKLSPDFGWRSRTRGIYDPPEAGLAQPAPAADIWSLGILLVEALTQQPPVWELSQGGEPEVPATLPEPFFTIARECLRVDPARRSTLAAVKARLNPGQAAEPPAEPTVARPPLKSRAILFAGAALVLLLMVGAFELGWNLTPSSSAPTAQPPVSSPAAAQPQPSIPKPAASSVAEPSTAPASPAAAAPASVAEPSAAPVPEPTAATASPAATASAPFPAAKPASTPVQAAETQTGGVQKGSVAHQALPEIPEQIMGAIQGHVSVRIRVEVDADGNVAHASIDSAGPSRYFANQALHAAGNWKFSPARVSGRTAPSTWLLDFQFTPSQTAVAESEESP